MEIPVALLEAISVGAAINPHETMMILIEFYTEHGFTAREVVEQLILLGYSMC